MWKHVEMETCGHRKRSHGNVQTWKLKHTDMEKSRCENTKVWKDTDTGNMQTQENAEVETHTDTENAELETYRHRKCADMETDTCRQGNTWETHQQESTQMQKLVDIVAYRRGNTQK